jgi:hypothetical protein
LCAQLITACLSQLCFVVCASVFRKYLATRSITLSEAPPQPAQTNFARHKLHSCHQIEFVSSLFFLNLVTAFINRDELLPAKRETLGNLNNFVYWPSLP